MRNQTTAIILAAALIISVFIAAAALRYKFRSPETITVTGLAETSFTSDQIVWQGSFSRTGYELKTAYAAVKADEATIRQYLKSSGIPDSAVVFSSIDVQRLYQTQYDDAGRDRGQVFNGFSLRESVTVSSTNIPVVEKLSREITGLLEQGIELNSTAPSYYYSKLNELKIDLLAKAAADAKLRAETIAKNSDASLGNIRKANMGVFQITGKNENEDYSYGGVFNTSSKDKKATITLKTDYAVN